MEACKLFAACRESYRRKKNAESHLEQLQFVVTPEYYDYQVDANEAPTWVEYDPAPGKTPEMFKGSTAPTDSGDRWVWAYNAYMSMCARRDKNSNEVDYMFVDHDHKESSGELYFRVAFWSPPSDGAGLWPIISIHDVATGVCEFDAQMNYADDYSAKVEIRYNTKGGNVAHGFSFTIPLGAGDARLWNFDLRVYLSSKPGVAPRASVERIGHVETYHLAMDGAEGSGFRDTAGIKRITLGSTRIDGLMPPSNINWARVAMGNKAD